MDSRNDSISSGPGAGEKGADIQNEYGRQDSIETSQVNEKKVLRKM